MLAGDLPHARVLGARIGVHVSPSSFTFGFEGLGRRAWIVVAVKLACWCGPGCRGIFAAYGRFSPRARPRRHALKGAFRQGRKHGHSRPPRL